MKRVLSLVLASCFSLLFFISAVADAKISVKEKKLFTFEGDWKAYFFAKVENTGDTAAYLEYGGKLVGFDADDNVILTESYISSYPSRLRLEPGEYAYVEEYILEDELKTNTIADYKFSIKPEQRGTDYVTLPSQAKIDYHGVDSYDNYVYVTLTNTTSEVLYNFAVTVAMYDQNNELMYVNGDSSSSIGIHPGSTVTIRVSIDSDLAEYYARNSLIPSTVESIVYTQE